MYLPLGFNVCALFLGSIRGLRDLSTLRLILSVLILFDMDNYDYTLPSEKTAFIAYNIGVYETVQKFGESIIKGKITPNMDISRIAEVLSESYSFYDSEIISQIVNAMIRQNKESTSIIGSVTSKDVDQVMRQLKTSGISLP